MPSPPPARSALGARSRHPAAPADDPAATPPAASAPPAAPAPTSSSTRAPSTSSDEATVPLSVRVPRSLRQRVKRAALDQDTSVQEWVIEAVEAHLAAQER